MLYFLLLLVMVVLASGVVHDDDAVGCGCVRLSFISAQLISCFRVTRERRLLSAS